MNIAVVQDVELIARVHRGDVTAFQQLFNRYWTLLFEIATKKCGDPREAEDIVQELFIDLWSNKGRRHITSTFRTYLISSLYLKIFKWYRNKGFREKHYEEFARIITNIDFSTENLDISLKDLENEHGKLTDMVAQTIALMPPTMRTVFSLKYIDGFSNAEIAGQLNVSPATVKTHLRLALSRLRKAGDEYSSPLLLLPPLLAIMQSSH